MFEIEEISGISNNFQNIECIPRLNKKSLSYNAFFQEYMSQNKCCIIQNVTEDWGAYNLWVTGNDIDYEYLKSHYGSLNVNVYNCLEREFNSQKCYDTTFNNYLDYFEASVQHEVFNDKLDYLKNWHLQLNTDDNFYDVPIYFASDWLNEYCVKCLNDDYRFVYMGPKNTWTPFHADVFSSYSWSANVYGRKRWILFPPGEEQTFKDSFENLPYDISTENISVTKHFDIIQEPGEVIFVPSGWYHQVWNLDNTVSINHNWINGCNINIMFRSLTSHLNSIEKEIEDCKAMEDFQEHCQLMLNTLFGMDFYKFYDFLKCIALSRIGMIQGSTSKTMFHGLTIGNNHIQFDLKSIRDVLVKFVENEVVTDLKRKDNVDIVPLKLLEKIENIINT